MLDLFCGRWGWSRAFAARGWECVGVDLVEPSEIPEGCRFVRCDVMELESPRNYDFICASPPCEQFSVHGMKNFHPNPDYPVEGLRLFGRTLLLCQGSGVPHVIENVRAAQQFVGNAVQHCGPFYLWGNAVPPLLPKGITKGFGKMDREFILKIGSSRSKKRAEYRAKVATIPPELAACVADYATEICGVKA